MLFTRRCAPIPIPTDMHGEPCGEHDWLQDTASLRSREAASDEDRRCSDADAEGSGRTRHVGILTRFTSGEAEAFVWSGFSLNR